MKRNVFFSGCDLALFFHTNKYSPNDIDSATLHKNGIFGKAASHFFHKNVKNYRELIKNHWLDNDSETRSFLEGLFCSEVKDCEYFNGDELEIIVGYCYENTNSFVDILCASWRDQHSIYGSICKHLPLANTLENRRRLYCTFLKHYNVFKEELENRFNTEDRHVKHVFPTNIRKTYKPDEVNVEEDKEELSKRDVEEEDEELKSPRRTDESKNRNLPDAQLDATNMEESNVGTAKKSCGSTSDISDSRSDVGLEKKERMSKRKRSRRTHPSGFGQCTIFLGVVNLSLENWNSFAKKKKRLDREKYNCQIPVICKEFTKECGLNVRHTRENKTSPIVVSNLYCTHESCRKFKITIDTYPTEQRDAKISVYCDKRNIIHQVKLTKQARGGERKKLKKNLRKEYPSVVRYNAIRQANEDIVMKGNAEGIHTTSALQKMSQEDKFKIALHHDDMQACAIQKRLDAEKLPKYEQNIQDIIEPLGVYLYSDLQIDIILFVIQISGKLPVLHSDCTGCLVRTQPHLPHKMFVYAGVIVFEGVIIPVFELLSCRHSTIDILVFLLKFRSFASKFTSKWPLFAAVVVDMSWPLLHAYCRAFNDMQIKDYILFTYEAMNLRASMKGKCVLVLCCAHILKIVADDASLYSNTRESKNLKKELMSAIIQAPNFKQIVNIFRDMVVVFENIYLSNALQYAVDRLKNITKTNESVKIEEEETKNFNLEETGVMYKDSPFFKYFTKIKMETCSSEMVNSSIEKEDNPFYSCGWIDHVLKKFMAILPFVTCALVPGRDRLANDPVENIFRFDKVIVARNKRNLLPTEFIKESRKMTQGKCKEIKFELNAECGQHVHSNTKLKTSPEKENYHENENVVWSKRRPQDSLPKKKKATSFDMKTLQTENILSKKPHPLKRRKGQSVLDDYWENSSKRQKLDIQKKIEKQKILKDANSYDPFMKTTASLACSNDMQAPAHACVTDVMVLKKRLPRMYSNGIISDIRYYSKYPAPLVVFKYERICYYTEDASCLLDGHWLLNVVIDILMKLKLQNNPAIRYVNCAYSTDVLKYRIQSSSLLEKSKTTTLLDNFKWRPPSETDEDTYITEEKIADRSKNEDLVLLYDLVHSETIIMPFNKNNNHWCGIVAFKSKQEVIYYDPLSSTISESLIMSDVFQSIWDNLPNSPKITWKPPKERLILPKQKDGYNCGIYFMYTMLSLCGLVKGIMPSPIQLREDWLQELLSNSEDMTNICLFCGKATNYTYRTRSAVANTSSRRSNEHCNQCSVCKRYVHEQCEKFHSQRKISHNKTYLCPPCRML